MLNNVDTEVKMDLQAGPPDVTGSQERSSGLRPAMNDVLGFLLFECGKPLPWTWRSPGEGTRAAVGRLI